MESMISNLVQSTFFYKAVEEKLEAIVYQKSLKQ